jgi:hypothetical protein
MEMAIEPMVNLGRKRKEDHTLAQRMVNTYWHLDLAAHSLALIS